MARRYDIKDLEYWDARIREKVAEFGLVPFAQEFELCDHEQMLNGMAYHGMPSHYPHWSYGKAYERLKTLYVHGVSGLPYEMVINSDPCLAQLMRKNSLGLQILTIAHVYAHSDFFRNNATFGKTQPDQILSATKARAQRVRGYIEDPSIGLQLVEPILDAAHALSLQCAHDLAIKKLTRSEQKERAVAAARPAPDPFRRIHKPPVAKSPDLNRVPLEPEPDLLLFVRDHNPRLAAWQKDLLTIVHEEALYFIPQLQTKIMNEGWATYWHWQILDGLKLPQDLHLEFLVRHNQVVRPIPGGINPYHLGYMVWQDVRRRGDRPTFEEGKAIEKRDAKGRELLLEVRRADRDVSFLRRFLTKELIRELGLFQYTRKGDTLIATRVADDEGWREVKKTLLKNIGTRHIPVIRVVDADDARRGTLRLHHEHDGRDLDLEYAEKTLAYVYRLWDRPVVLETRAEDAQRELWCDEDGLSIK